MNANGHYHRTVGTYWCMVRWIGSVYLYKCVYLGSTHTYLLSLYLLTYSLTFAQLIRLIMWYMVLQIRGLNGTMGRINQVNSILILVNVIANILIIPIGYIHDRYYFSLSKPSQQFLISLKVLFGNSFTYLPLSYFMYTH